MKRRDFMMTGLCAVMYGCESAQRSSTLPNMGGVWPDVNHRPSGSRSRTVPSQPEPSQPPVATSGSVTPISRSRWAGAGPNRGNINLMNGVNRITVHHEGMPEAVHFTDYATTRARMEMIRQSHRRRGWADIGYHYVIDRAGRVWEGRPITYQGAHVRDNNEHNIGVMCMGNFDIQQPSNAQLQALAATVQHLRRYYRVSEHAIKTHQEINPTACPGRNLQPRVASMRSQHLFA